MFKFRFLLPSRHPRLRVHLHLLHLFHFLFFLLLLFLHGSDGQVYFGQDCIPLNVSEASYLVVNSTASGSGAVVTATCKAPYVVNSNRESLEVTCQDGVWKPYAPRCTDRQPGGAMAGGQLIGAVVGSVLGVSCCVCLVVFLCVCLPRWSRRQDGDDDDEKGKEDSKSKYDLEPPEYDDDLRLFTRSNALRGIADPYFQPQDRTKSSDSIPDADDVTMNIY